MVLGLLIVSSGCILIGYLNHSDDYIDSDDYIKYCYNVTESPYISIPMVNGDMYAFRPTEVKCLNKTRFRGNMPKTYFKKKIIKYDSPDLQFVYVIDLFLTSGMVGTTTTLSTEEVRDCRGLLCQQFVSYKYEIFGAGTRPCSYGCINERTFFYTPTFDYGDAQLYNTTDCNTIVKEGNLSSRFNIHNFWCWRE